jgi:anthranilate synthase/aminodeoxychorismate synthase-like glutamine amidotransferase
MTSVLVVDNYDSFTYNLVQYLGELGAEVDVVRNDLPELLERSPDRVIVSPGPCTPEEAGLSKEAIRRYAEAGVPVLGVCLGHQALAAAYGGLVVRGEPVHGKTAEAEHDGRTIFERLESPLVVGRYHSLVVDPGLPGELQVSARSTTATTPLPGGGTERSGVPHLDAIYGSRAPRVLALADGDPALAQPLAPGYPDIVAEVVYAARYEWCEHPRDFTLRRSYLGFQRDRGQAAGDAIEAALHSDVPHA